MARQVRLRRKRHALRRAMTRFDLNLSGSDIDAIVNLIIGAGRNGGDSLTVVPLERHSHTSSLIAVRYRDEWLPVIYNRDRKEIKTILPKAVLEERGFVPPRLATPEEQQADFLAGRKVRKIVFDAV